MRKEINNTAGNKTGSLGKRSLPSVVVRRAKSAGAAGEAWLANLDRTVSELEHKWNITVGEALSGGTHALVAPAEGPNGEQYVLKADMPEDLGGDFESGMRALKTADGHGYVKLYAYDPERKACLLERLGKPLDQLEYSVFEKLRIICAALQKAWEVPTDGDGFSSGSVEWFREFLGEAWEELGHPCSRRVMELAFSYLRSREEADDPSEYVLLHGDAHGGNTLHELSGGGFKLIDPDGLFYEKAYDLGVLMREWWDEYREEPLKKGRERCRYLCRLTGVSEKGIWEWGYLQTVSTSFVLLKTGQEEAGREMLRVAESWAEGDAAGGPEYMDSLGRFLAEEYGFDVKKLLPAKRGFYGETWNVLAESGTYFLKLDYWEHHKESLQNSLLVIQYMTDSGIDFIPKVIGTKDGILYSRFRQGTAAVFEHVPGELSEDYATEQLYGLLTRVYRLNTDGLEVETETFDGKKAEVFQALQTRPELPAEVKTALAEKAPDISRYMERLKQLSAACQGKKEHFHITHGDAGGNCILNGGRLSIVDWDGAMLAPIERDAWIYICDKAAMEAIHSTLLENGIDYELEQNRLCYYCYDFFFHYLNEYLRSLLDAESGWQREEITKGLAGYLADCWIYERLDAADAMG